MTRVVPAALLAAAALWTVGPAGARLTSAVPAIYPVPQSIVAGHGSIAVPPVVRLITTYGSDASAATTVRTALQAAGITVTSSSSARLWVYVGRNAHAEAELGAKTAAGLPAEGYVLAAGRGTDGQARVVLDGANHAGQFYAAQTFRQLLDHRLALPSLVIRDWPSFHRRGVVEGFYGTPWSQAETLSMLDFMGAHKLDFFMYGPKDDPYLRSEWNVPFPAAYRAMLRSYVAHAASNHVTFNLVLSPGLSACYTSPADQQTMLAKLETAYALGVRSFTLAFDDVPLNRPQCASDAALGTGEAGVALGQASLANTLEAALEAAHPGLPPLIVVPTEYSGIDPSAYTSAFSSALDPAISVEWTGRYGTSVAIPQSDADAARSIYGHPVILWDNYYVTDYAPGYLALGALDRHDATLPTALSGIVADPMAQEEASQIGLFTLADYAWDPAQYNLSRSWNASLREFAGGDGTTTTALRAFADMNWGSALNPLQAPGLAAAIDAFWTQWGAGDASAATTLDAQLAVVQNAATVLRGSLGNPEFLTEVSPWLDATTAWATAARTALAVLVDTSTRNAPKAKTDRALLDNLVSAASRFALLTPPIAVGGTVLTTFIKACETQAGG